jgi:hypothetical protein
MKPLPGHALLVSRGADLRGASVKELGQERAEAIVERLVLNVIEAYAPNVERGFCVGYGAITSEPSQNEQALISFAHRVLPDLHIRFMTRTISAPDTSTYSDLHEESRIAGMTGSEMTVLVEQNRMVAGLQGKEIRISMVPGNEPGFVRFTWHYAGVPGRGDQPAIDIMGTASSEHKIVLEAVWESMLESLARIPL